jgi:hypothetical protein
LQESLQTPELSSQARRATYRAAWTLRLELSKGAFKPISACNTPLAQPKSTLLIINDTQRHQRRGSAWNEAVSKGGVLVPPQNQPNPAPCLCSALSGPQRPQQTNSCVTTCQMKHVCIDAQACRRVAEMLVQTD